MGRVHLAIWVVLLSIAASAAAGDVWINCAPGYDIFLDGEHAGVSERAEFGKNLRGITSGDHTVRLEEEGLTLAEFSVDVGGSEIQVVVGALAPKLPEVSPGGSEIRPGEKPVGTITITSDPSECNVKYAGEHIPKIKPIMTFPMVPVGGHTLWFESSGTVLKETVPVQEAQSAKVMVDFHNRRIVITDDTEDVDVDESEAETETTRGAPECIEYWIEVLRSQDREVVDAYQKILEDLGFYREHQKVITIEDDGAAPVYKLRVGPIERKKKAKWAAGLIKNAGLSNVWILPDECQPPSERPKREFRPMTAGG